LWPLDVRYDSTLAQRTMSLTEAQKKWCDQVALWLREQLKTVSHSETEIELRFGTYTDSVAASAAGNADNFGSFVSGVSADQWHRVREMFAAMESTVHTRPPESVLDIVFLYNDQEKGKSWRRIHHADGSLTVDQKIKLSNVETVMQTAGCREKFGVRISHSSEKELVPSAHNEGPTNASLVRVRARTSYWYKMWRIDLSLVQQGCDKERALNAPASYEIEVELLLELIDWSKHDFHYLALSLLLRIGDIAANIAGISPNKVTMPDIGRSRTVRFDTMA